jgi:hypothetical protein
LTVKFSANRDSISEPLGKKHVQLIDGAPRDSMTSQLEGESTIEEDELTHTFAVFSQTQVGKLHRTLEVLAALVQSDVVGSNHSSFSFNHHRTNVPFMASVRGS